MIRDEMSAIAGGAASSHPLLGFAISELAVWACTSCGACIDICPVGNEPMLDILDIRRDQVLMQGEFPAELQSAFRGMGAPAQPVGQSGEPLRLGQRHGCADGGGQPHFDVLYWVAPCAVL
jgi:Fe-S oxidoreductase